jgi:site-specific recombinase XerD
MLSSRDFNEEIVQRFIRWLTIQHYVVSTQKGYLGILRAYCGSLGSKMITAATHNDILEFLAKEAQRGQSLGSLHHKMDSLRMFYDFLRIGGLQDRSPARLIRLRPLVRQIPRVLSEEEVQKLIAHSRNPRDRVILELLYSTGCRNGELARIRIEDIDFSGRSIRVVGKGHTRSVLFGKKAEEAILNYTGDRRCGYLFKPDYRLQCGWVVRKGPSWCGRWMDYGTPDRSPRARERRLGRTKSITFWQAKQILLATIEREHARRPESEKPPSTVTILIVVGKVAALAGLGHVTPRMLRHSFATHLMNRGANIRFIQELMGHAWVQTTQFYTQVTKQSLAAAYRTYHPRGA